MLLQAGILPLQSYGPIEPSADSEFILSSFTVNDKRFFARSFA
tara:strand:- start:344 stop:472 length:129 start_codon:yes stop_codon:yes gene_type:complete